MRRYQKERMIISISAQQIAKEIAQKYPLIKASQIRKLSREYAKEAFRQLKAEGKSHV